MQRHAEVFSSIPIPKMTSQKTDSRYSSLLGGLSVECCRTEDEGYLEAGKNYSVIESTALFEAYRYNLKVLQNIDPLLVPMEKYIVRLEKVIVPPQVITRGTCVNLSPIMSDSRNTDTEVSLIGEDRLLEL